MLPPLLLPTLMRPLSGPDLLLFALCQCHLTSPSLGSFVCVCVCFHRLAAINYRSPTITTTTTFPLSRIGARRHQPPFFCSLFLPLLSLSAVKEDKYAAANTNHGDENLFVNSDDDDDDGHIVHVRARCSVWYGRVRIMFQPGRSLSLSLRFLGSRRRPLARGGGNFEYGLRE